MRGAALVSSAYDKPQTAQENAVANAALATAAQPSAGTVAAEVAHKTDPGGPPVTLSEALDAGSDEAPQQLRDKAASASKIVPADSPEATPDQP